MSSAQEATKNSNDGREDPQRSLDLHFAITSRVRCVESCCGAGGGPRDHFRGQLRPLILSLPVRKTFVLLFWPSRESRRSPVTGEFTNRAIAAAESIRRHSRRYLPLVSFYRSSRIPRDELVATIYALVPLHDLYDWIFSQNIGQYELHI